MRFNPHSQSKPITLPPEQPGSITRRASTLNPQPSTGFQTTVTKNERNGVEIRFPTKPDDAVRETLKRQGFRWHGGRACWYHRLTPENWEFAQEFLSAECGTRSAESDSASPVTPHSALATPHCDSASPPAPPATLHPQPSTTESAIIKVDFAPTPPTPHSPLPTPHSLTERLLRRSATTATILQHPCQAA